MRFQLTERQQQILSLVVRTYIEDGIAVGSKTLVERYHLYFSSATVRNELAALSEMGYVIQAHTSGGRIPTENGYRYFVQRLVGDFELPLFEQQMIRHQFHQTQLDWEQWMRLSAAMLARISHSASFVTAPRPRFSRFKHLELINTQGRRVLMVAVFQGGSVKQQILTLATPLSQTRLTSVASQLNQLFASRTIDEVRMLLTSLEELEQEIGSILLLWMHQKDNQTVRQIYRDGFANIVNDEGTRQAVRLLEERSLLNDVMKDVLVSDQSGVQVIIGGEGRWEELKHCTIILSRYGTEDDMGGEVAVVGPTRMPYGRNISAVRYLADIMSGLTHDYFVSDFPDMDITTKDRSSLEDQQNHTE